ncbi:MAG: hypothetical protein O2782_02360 [bacterium]|nr:hypothetical protein [bacterium]
MTTAYTGPGPVELSRWPTRVEEPNWKGDDEGGHQAMVGEIDAAGVDPGRKR